MKRGLLALSLLSFAWADDQGVVKEVFRRPEFRWKFGETQPGPPVCPPPAHWDLGGPYGGRPDRSGGVAGTSDPNGLIDPYATPEPSEGGEPSDSATPSQSGTPSASPVPPRNGTLSGAATPVSDGPPSSASPPTSSQSGSPSPDPSQTTETPSTSRTPSLSGTQPASFTPPEIETTVSSAAPDSGEAPAESPEISSPNPSASATPELPDHPPPPLDYAEPPGFWEKLARGWNIMLGRPSKSRDGVHQILLFLRDLLVLVLFGLFLRHLLPLFRQLRSWFKTEPPPKIPLDDEQAPPPEILPEWRHLWLQALSQDRPARAQRLGYLAVLSFLDHHGHIRYRACGTNREYVALLDSQSPLRDGFAGLTRSFERCRYGGQEPDFDEFQAACRRILAP